ncbi:acyl-CoA carboxylase epsilon subunit [Nocardia alni]|uniref:acyl-CoA carboxylase epsilon subunit n=1 Tax=Nocardia alni TaxID=2815723 RepID=UPI001C2207EA|nr:acyl-CoA carboxylase epsilon subunit [Nocardia alni]
MTAVADEEVLRAAELALSVDDLVDTMEAPAADESGSAGVAGVSGAGTIRILKGSPTEVEVAALACVFAAAASAGASAPTSTGPVDLWGMPTLMHRGASPFSPYAFPFLSHMRD